MSGMTDEQLFEVQAALWTARDDARLFATLSTPYAAFHARRQREYQDALEIVTEVRGYPPRELVEAS
jgi:hypothetical protein